MNAIDIVFEWLLAATLRASVLAVAILGIQLLLRRWLPAGWRHALWLPMLAVLVLPILPSAPFGVFPLAEKSAVPASLVPSGAIMDGTAAEGSVALIQPGTPISKLNYLAFAWLAGACSVFAAGVVGYCRNLRRVKKAATLPDATLLFTIGKVVREAGLSYPPRVIVSSAVDSPAVTGLLHPVLLLPAGFPEGFNATETRLILLHEFSHLKRLDLPLNWLACVLQAMHWFNPLLWFAFARMRADREAACDARVLSIDAEDRRAEYGGALLKLQGMALSRSLSLGFVGIFERGSEMKSRIREISNHRRGHFLGQAAGGSILTLLLIFGATKAQEAKPPDGSEAKAVPVGGSEGEVYIINKLRTIVIPAIDFEDSSIDEAVDFISLRAKELDVAELDPAKKGINFVVRKSRKDGKSRAPFGSVTMSLKNVSLEKAVKLIAEQSGARYKVDDFAVTFVSEKEIAEPNAAEEIQAPPKKQEGRAADAANKMFIPNVEFFRVTLQEAVDFLNLRVKELSKDEPAFLIVIDPAVDAKMVIDRELRLRGAPVSVILKYCVEDYGLVMFVDDKEIRIKKQ